MERVLMIELITRSDVFTENMDERRRRNAGSPRCASAMPLVRQVEMRRFETRHGRKLTSRRRGRGDGRAWRAAGLLTSWKRATSPGPIVQVPVAGALLADAGSSSSSLRRGAATPRRPSSRQAERAFAPYPRRSQPHMLNPRQRHW